MDTASFVAGVRFRFFDPASLPTRDEMESRVENHTPIDVTNTVLPDDHARLTDQVGALCWIPKMSTFAIGALINHAVRQMPADRVFLNIGLWCGFTVLSGMVGNPDKTCIGVDNFSEFSFETHHAKDGTGPAPAAATARPSLRGPGQKVLAQLAATLRAAITGVPFDEASLRQFAGLNGPRELFGTVFDALKGPAHQFHEMDYRDYFARVHRQPIGLYLYDGSHAYDDQLEGLRLAEPFFADGCIVLVDDTNAPDPRNATLDFVKGRPGHRYRLLFDQPTSGNGHPTWWNGLMVFQRVS